MSTPFSVAGGRGGGSGSGFITAQASGGLTPGVQTGDGKIVLTYVRDTTAPQTNIALSPAAPSGQNGWYVGPVTVSISATDPDDTSGVVTRCILDPTSPPTSFSALPTAACPYLGSGASVSSEGVHTVYAASIDPAGNAEVIRGATFKIDTTKPSTNVSAIKPVGTAHVSLQATADVFATDSGGKPVGQKLGTLSITCFDTPGLTIMF